MVQEEWRLIKGYGGCYEVSNFGRVRSLDRVTIDTHGRRRLHEGKVLKPYDNQHYPSIGLSFGHPRKINTRRVHSLVAESFIDSDYKNKGLIVNHKDGNKKNNHVSNLEVVTVKENCRHARELGLNNQVGLLSSCAKLTKEEVLWIREDRDKNKKPFTYYANILNVSRSTVENVYYRKCYNDVR